MSHCVLGPIAIGIPPCSCSAASSRCGSITDYQTSCCSGESNIFSLQAMDRRCWPRRCGATVCSQTRIPLHAETRCMCRKVLLAEEALRCEKQKVRSRGLYTNKAEFNQLDVNIDFLWFSCSVPSERLKNTGYDGVFIQHKSCFVKR